LTSTELDAVADVPGTFVYSPDVGTLLPTQPDNDLSVTFTPTDTTDYNVVTFNNVIDVFPATPTITWPNPADVAYGIPLGSTQLNATATLNGALVSGTFNYSPSAGTVLPVGQLQHLDVTFSPTDTTDFVTATASASINVNPLTVLNTNDAGPGSLRQALLDAENLPGTTHTIIFQLPAGPQVISSSIPLPAITDPITAIVDASQDVMVCSPAGGAANCYSALTKMGAGLLTLSGANQYSSNLQVHTGRLRLAASAAATVAAGLTFTVDGAAALELAGTASNLSGAGHRVSIANGSTAAAGIEVTGTHQVVGNIAGGGTLAIDAGADLTANQIVQGALVIGGSFGNFGALSIAASDSSGNPLAASASDAGSSSTAVASSGISAMSFAAAATTTTATSRPAPLPATSVPRSSPDAVNRRAFFHGLAKGQILATDIIGRIGGPAAASLIDPPAIAARASNDSTGPSMANIAPEMRSLMFVPEVVDSVLAGADSVADDTLIERVADGAAARWESLWVDLNGDLSSPEYRNF
jgi:autotransporter-associated beta strand protein